MTDCLVNKKIKAGRNSRTRSVFFLFRCNRFVHVYQLRERATGEENIETIKEIGDIQRIPYLRP